MTEPRRLALTGATIYTGDQVLSDRAVVIEEGAISSLTTELDESRFAGEIIELTGCSLAPGLIDLQVNGGGDRLFNDSPSPEGLATIVDAHRLQGTTDLLATYVTGPRAGLTGAARAVVQAIALGIDGLLGLHFEGPLLSPLRRGVHDPLLLRNDPDDQILDDLTSTAGSCPTVVTLAPEVVPAGFIAELVARGAVVSAGHTEATPVQIRRAIDEGLRAATHVWNGMPPIASREPGPVAALLADPRVWCGFIADGQHLADETLAFSLAAKAAGRSMLVSDAMPPVGGSGKTFLLEGLEITHAGDRCVTPQGKLAGGAVPLVAGVRWCVEKLGVPLDEAIRMATLYPAECLGVADTRGRIAPGYPARLVALDPAIRPVLVVTGSRLDHISPAPR